MVGSNVNILDIFKCSLFRETYSILHLKKAMNTKMVYIFYLGPQPLRSVLMIRSTEVCLSINSSVYGLKLLASLMRNYFPKRSSGAHASYFFTLCQNCMMFLLVLYPPPLLRQCIALFTVAEGWLLLDIGRFVLFFYHHVITLPTPGRHM